MQQQPDIRAFEYKGYYITCASLAGSRFSHRGYGIDTDSARSGMIALAELAERTRAGGYENIPMHHFAYADGLFPTVPLEHLRLLGEQFSEDVVYPWCEVVSLKNGKNYFAPASNIFVPFSTAQPTANAVQTSVGLAAHYDRDQAILKSVYEILERHFFYLAWVGEVAVSKIGEYGTVRQFCIENPLGLYIVLTMLVRNEPPYVSTGISATDNLEEAIDHSVKEALLSEWYNLTLLEEVERHGKEFDFSTYMKEAFFRHAFDKTVKKSREMFFSKSVPINCNNLNEKRSGFDLPGAVEYFGDIYICEFGQSPADSLVVTRALIPGAVLTHYQVDYSGCGIPLI